VEALAMKPASDASGTHLWLVLMKSHRALSRHAQRSVDSAEMGLSEFAALELLLHKGPQPVNAIGRRIDLTSGSITSAVDRLEKRGLVERGADPDDRRARVVRLTAKGKALITKVFAGHKAAMDRAAAGLSAAERTTLIQLLKKLGTSADGRFEGEPSHE
jgi:MarR family transcriptional regulator, 2-MHQ and catechol-resistance regulon repressor